LLDEMGAPLDGRITDGELPADLREWLSDQEYDHPMVAFSCEREDSAWTRFALRQSDLVVLVAEAAGDPQPSALERELLAGEDAPAGTRALVLMHGVGEAISGTARWLAPRELGFHLHFRAGAAPPGVAGPVQEHTASVDGPAPLPATGAYGPGDLNRIVRVLSGKATGLVLSAGAMRSLAQLGVYRALREAGINIDWVGGCSIGSIVAATIAMDWGPEEATSRARTAFLQGKPFSDLTIPITSLLSGARMKNLLTANFDLDIVDLPLPYFCVSSNLDRGQLNVHQRGRLVDAIRASAALPGMMPPQVVDNELAVDGAVLNSLPVDIMQERPVRTIIAVDVSSLSPRTVEYAETPSAWQILRSRWLPWTKQHGVPSLATVMLKAAEIGAKLQARRLASNADLVLRPPVQQYDLTDVRSFDRIVKAGHEYAVQEIGRWLKDKRQGQVTEIAGPFQ